METIKQHRVVIAVVIVILAIICVIWATHQGDNDDKKVSVDTSKQQAADKKAAEEKAAAAKKTAAKTKNYSYTAASGDSYTVLARKSLESYAKANDVTLSKAQIVAGETKLSQAYDWKLLNVGQKVTISHSQLKSTVSSVQKLSKSELAAWQQYVPYVVF